MEPFATEAGAILHAKILARKAAVHHFAADEVQIFNRLSASETPAIWHPEIWIIDAHGYGKHFIVRADEKLTAFVELQQRHAPISCGSESQSCFRLDKCRGRNWLDAAPLGKVNLPLLSKAIFEVNQYDS